jgi:hypothetical protein
MEWKDLPGSSSDVSSSTILTSVGGGGLLGETKGKPLSQYPLILEIRTGNRSKASYDRCSLSQRRNLSVATLQYRLMTPSTVPMK